MILESLIKDESMVTLDCAKARISRGDTIELNDKYWHEAEIQGAIKLGLVRLVGNAPNVQKSVDRTNESRTEETKMFISTAKTRLAFECDTKYRDPSTGDTIKWKEWVDPGQTIRVPLSSINDKEIQNALGWNLLSDPSKKEENAIKGPSKPVILNETSVRPRNRKIQTDLKSKAKAVTKADPSAPVMTEPARVEIEARELGNLLISSPTKDSSDLTEYDLEDLLDKEDLSDEDNAQPNLGLETESHQKENKNNKIFLELFGDVPEENTEQSEEEF